MSDNLNGSRVTLIVNGHEEQVRADHPHLLSALREELDITSPKDGCSPSGQCGCCTVLIDDSRVPGLLHAALHLTAHTRARVRSIDTARAVTAAGVVAVFTAADIPGELRVELIHKDGAILIPVDGQTSCSADVLAVVVAD